MGIELEDAESAVKQIARTIKIVFISPEAACNRYIWYLNFLTPEGDYRWVTPKAVVTAVVTPFHADYVVVLGRETEESQSIPNSRKIFFQLDPKESVPRGYAVLALLEDHYRVAIPWNFTPYKTLIQQDMPIKTKSLVVIFSNKEETPLQKQRLELVKMLSADPSIDITIYGRNHSPGDFPHGYQGMYNPRDKAPLLKDYRYCLAIEKHALDNFVTNHFIDPLLSYTVPLYAGAPNVGKLYPPECFHVLTDFPHNLVATVNHIRKLIHQPVTVSQVAAMSTARRLILNEYSVWATLKDRLPRL